MSLLKRPPAANATWLPFATVGYFPVRESLGAKSGRNVMGAQVGVQWEPGTRTRLKLGVAQYRFDHFEGRVDPEAKAQEFFTDAPPNCDPARSSPM